MFVILDIGFMSGSFLNFIVFIVMYLIWVIVNIFVCDFLVVLELYVRSLGRDFYGGLILGVSGYVGKWKCCEFL